MNETPLEIFYLSLSGDLFRYFLIAGAAFLVLWLGRKRWSHKLVQGKRPETSHIKREILFSILSMLIFALMVVGQFELDRLGVTPTYYNIADYGWTYFFASIGIIILFQDTYFYWAHRLMHTKFLMKHIHMLHHRSTNPTPWAAFAFHPGETVIEFMGIGLAQFFVPLHPTALLAVLIFSLIMNVYGHNGYELMPKWFGKHPVFKYVLTSTLHNMHHKYFKSNYSLYFNHWDRWMGTLHPEYENKFQELAERKAA